MVEDVSYNVQWVSKCRKRMCEAELRMCST